MHNGTTPRVWPPGEELPTPRIVRRRLHYPLHDGIRVEPPQTLAQHLTGEPRPRLALFTRSKYVAPTESRPGMANAPARFDVFEARGLRLGVSALRDDGALDGVTFLFTLLSHTVTRFRVQNGTAEDKLISWSMADLNPGQPQGPSHPDAPAPQTTYRFPAPTHIEHGEKFFIDIEFTQGIPGLVTDVRSPYRLWCIVDGYLVPRASSRSPPTCPRRGCNA